MDKFLKFCFYTILGVVIAQIFRVLSGSSIDIDGVFTHLWYGLLTAGTYHWFLSVNKDEKTSNQ